MPILRVPCKVFLVLFVWLEIAEAGDTDRPVALRIDSAPRGAEVTLVEPNIDRRRVLGKTPARASISDLDELAYLEARYPNHRTSLRRITRTSPEILWFVLDYQPGYDNLSESIDYADLRNEADARYAEVEACESWARAPIDRARDFRIGATGGFVRLRGQRSCFQTGFSDDRVFRSDAVRVYAEVPLGPKEFFREDRCGGAGVYLAFRDRDLFVIKEAKLTCVAKDAKLYRCEGSVPAESWYPADIFEVSVGNLWKETCKKTER